MVRHPEVYARANGRKPEGPCVRPATQVSFTIARAAGVITIAHCVKLWLAVIEIPKAPLGAAHFLSRARGLRRCPHKKFDPVKRPRHRESLANTSFQNPAEEPENVIHQYGFEMIN
jgi:hypothetical protein